MIPVCALVKYQERDSIGTVMVFLDGEAVYWRRPEKEVQARAIAHLLNTLRDRLGTGRLLHIDIDYDIKEPPLC